MRTQNMKIKIFYGKCSNIILSQTSVATKICPFNFTCNFLAEGLPPHVETFHCVMSLGNDFRGEIITKIIHRT